MYDILKNILNIRHLKFIVLVFAGLCLSIYIWLIDYKDSYTVRGNSLAKNNCSLDNEKGGEKENEQSLTKENPNKLLFISCSGFIE